MNESSHSCVLSGTWAYGRVQAWPTGIFLLHPPLWLPCDNDGPKLPNLLIVKEIPEVRIFISNSPHFKIVD